MATFLILFVHFGYVFEGRLIGLPLITGSNDALKYYYHAVSIVRNGFGSSTVNYYEFRGAITYVITIAIQFIIFGINPLIIKFFNAFLFSLTLVFLGKFISYYFDFKFVKRSLVLFIIYTPFICRTTIPLKEILIYFFTLIILIQTYKLTQHVKLKNLLIFIFIGILLFYSRPYVAIILIICSLIIILYKFNFKNAFFALVILSIIFFVLINFRISGVAFIDMYENQSIYVGNLQSEKAYYGKGVQETFGIIKSGILPYGNMLFVQGMNTFFQPFFTSYPKRENFNFLGTYINSLIAYLGSFVWYLLLPSMIYGFYIMIKKRKDLIILYLPAIAFFIFFIFIRNRLRYQIVARIFWIIIGVYGFQFYPKWKKYIPLWAVLYLFIFMKTI